MSEFLSNPVYPVSVLVVPHPTGLLGRANPQSVDGGEETLTFGKLLVLWPAGGVINMIKRQPIEGPYRSLAVSSFLVPKMQFYFGTSLKTTNRTPTATETYATN